MTGRPVYAVLCRWRHAQHKQTRIHLEHGALLRLRQLSISRRRHFSGKINDDGDHIIEHVRQSRAISSRHSYFRISASTVSMVYARCHCVKHASFSTL